MIKYGMKSIPERQELCRWSLEMDKQFHPTIYNLLIKSGIKFNPCR